MSAESSTVASGTGYKAENVLYSGGPLPVQTDESVKLVQYSYLMIYFSLFRDFIPPVVVSDRLNNWPRWYPTVWNNHKMGTT
jgi:hypothetical protein